MVPAVLVSVRTQHHWTPEKACTSCKDQTNPTEKDTVIPILLSLFSHTNTKLVKHQTATSYMNKLKWFAVCLNQNLEKFNSSTFAIALKWNLMLCLSAVYHMDTDLSHHHLQARGTIQGIREIKFLISHLTNRNKFVQSEKAQSFLTCP